MASKSVSLAFKGDFAKDLERFVDNTQNKLVFTGLAAAARLLYEEAQLQVPVKTGLLRDNIFRAYSPKSSTREREVYHVTWRYGKGNANHGNLVEFGTSKQPPNPFMRRTSQRMGDALSQGLAAMTNKFDEAVK